MRNGRDVYDSVDTTAGHLSRNLGSLLLGTVAKYSSMCVGECVNERVISSVLEIFVRTDD